MSKSSRAKAEKEREERLIRKKKVRLRRKKRRKSVFRQEKKERRKGALPITRESGRREKKQGHADRDHTHTAKNKKSSS